MGCSRGSRLDSWILAALVFSRVWSPAGTRECETDRRRDSRDRTVLVGNEVSRFFTRRAALYDAFLVRFLTYGAGMRVLLARSVKLEPGKRILDAGCGTGLLTRSLWSVARTRGIDGIRFHAFDLTPAMLNRFRAWIAATGADAIELREADVLVPEMLPEEWVQFDQIVSSAMLEYVPRADLVSALRNLRARLRPGGTFLVAITRRNLLMKILIEWGWGSTAYSRDEIAAAVASAGFDEIRFLRPPFPHIAIALWGHVIEAHNPP